MGKKSRVSWIVGGIVVVVALFAATAFYIDYNSTDARLERAVAQFVEKYGFELQDQLPGYIGWPQGRVDSSFYKRAPMSAETAGEIVAILRDACPSCKYEHQAYDKDLMPVTTSAGDPWMVVHDFTPDVQDGGRIAGIVFHPIDKGFGDSEVEPMAGLMLSKFYTPSLWQRIKGLWPW